MKELEAIVIKPEGKLYSKVVSNPAGFELIGTGAQGAVFKLSEDKCAKVYHHNYHKKAEAEVLRDAGDSPFFPTIFETGSNYIIMEYIKGPTLLEFLQKKQSIPPWITDQIIDLFKEMRRLKFTRWDANLRHLLVTKDERIKFIDHCHSRKKEVNEPKKLCKKIYKLGVLEEFAAQVKEKDRGMYDSWKSTIKKYLSHE
ncbi:MAG: AarF/UbiB family protein [Bacillus sp. (in: Bacteria)]|nr:AarF/UbiB family protein [Bacillus sp. (in: firmicutes)]